MDLSVELVGWLGLIEHFDKVMDNLNCLWVASDL